MAALARAGDVEGSWLAAGLDDAFALVAGRFFRREVRVRVRACVAGMRSACGGNGALRACLGEEGPGYVIAVSCDHVIPWPGSPLLAPAWRSARGPARQPDPS